MSGNGKPYLTNVLANVRTVNFFNRKDYALNIWVMNNCSKPDNLEGVFKHDTSFNYGSSEIVDEGSETRQTQVGFYRHTETLGKLCIDPVGDEWARWCVFSFVTPTRSLAFGQLDMNGVVNRKVSLKDYGYGNDHYGHSRQFRSNITDVFEIWSIVKDEIERPFMPDQNQNVNSVED